MNISNMLSFLVNFLIVLTVVNSANIPNVGSETIKDEDINNIVEQMMEKKLEEILQTYEANQLQLTKKADDLARRLLSVEKLLRSQNERVKDLEKTNEELKKMLLSDDHVRQEFLNSHLENTDSEMKNSSMDGTANYPISARRNRRAVGQVAFTAYLTQTNEHTNVGEPIRFNQVLLNDGNGYNKYTGAFTAPLTGTYMFSFHFDTRKLTFVRLVVNGVNQVDAVANPHTGAQSRQSQSMGGNTAIVHVNHGEAVLVETYEIADAETASSDTFRLCTFSGVLLY